MDFDFFMPAHVVSGEHCIREHAQSLRGFGSRCLIITSAHAAVASGALGDIQNALDSCGIEASLFTGIGANPLLSQCQQAARAAQNAQAEFVIGIGGGSVMDASKAAAWLATNDVLDGDGLMAGRLARPPLPLVLVGTTAGTGSEVSAAAVITMDANHQKQSLAHPSCYARLVFADPRYTHTTSRATTVSTALDAFAHAVEGWFAPGCGDVITSFGEKALPLVTDGLYWLQAHDGELPDAALREKLYYGSLWAGMVLNATGTAFPHRLGYILTEEYAVDHGMACAVFLPSFLQRAEVFASRRADRLYALCDGRDRVLDMLEALVHADVVMTEEQIESYKTRWVDVPNFKRTPGGFLREDAAEVCHSLFVSPDVR